MGAYVANLRIEEMLEDCGECYIDGIYMEGFGQESCCEDFGGIYHGYDAPDEPHVWTSTIAWNCSYWRYVGFSPAFSLGCKAGGLEGIEAPFGCHRTNNSCRHLSPISPRTGLSD